MRLTLKKIIIENFKGIKYLEITFKDITNILGANRTGKSTIADAVNWLWFGKNQDESDKFSVKPLNDKNETTPKIETSVLAYYLMDTKNIVIKRTYKEVWTKLRGKSTAILDTHTTDYEWNSEVITKKSDFESKRNQLIDPNFFKLLTNPLYFNSDKLGWKKRREMLVKLATTKPIKSEFSTMSIDEFEELKKSLAAKIKKLKEELKSIPIRIDEVFKGKPEELNFKMIQADLNGKKRQIETIEAQIIDKSKVLTDFNNSRLEEQKKLSALKSELTLYESDFKLKNNVTRTELETKIQANGSDIKSIEGKIESLQKDIERNNFSIEGRKYAKDNLVKEWHKVNEQVFSQEACVACGQELPSADIEKNKKDFLFNQESSLERININGKKVLVIIGGLTQNNTNTLLEIGSLKDEQTKVWATHNDYLSELNKIKEPNIALDKEYITLLQNYELAEHKFNEVKPPTIDVSKLKVDKENAKDDIDLFTKQLQIKTTIQTAENRIKELEIQEQTKANILVGLEKQEFAMEGYTAAKMKALQVELNKMFKHVQFKMFEEQINGGQKETCTTLIRGVPFNDANSESKLNAGLEIINMFSEFYNISAPIFIDNREGITEIIDVKSQVINLIVNDEFKTLKIS